MIAAIVQARMGSTRLPGKTLAGIDGEPMLAHVARRAALIPGVERVVIATTDRPADDAIVRFAAAAGIPVHRGSETDVLDRVHGAAARYGVSVIVRVTPDCPLLDPDVAARVLRRFLDGGLDYASNTQPPTFPDGQDTEVFSFAALERASHEAQLASEREHVTPYIWKHPELFRLANVIHPEDLSSERWTVDTANDLEFARAVYARLGRRSLSMGAVLDLLSTDPSLRTINAGTERNEGYARSVREDRVLAPRTTYGGSMEPMSGGSLERSRHYLERARRVIPSCTQTFSKGPTQFPLGVAPVFVQRAEGSRVWDVDGNEYIDYPMALGPVILGHNDPDVTAAVQAQLKDGVTFSLPHPLEVEVAEMLAELIPCAEMVRYGKNGSDATSGAVRAARAFTGRERIACCGYHGWQDWYIGTTTRSRGVPGAVQALTHPFTYNDVASLEALLARHPGEFAAVILEPIGVEEPRDDFLQRVAACARDHGALLIFDEIITGFRVALGGAQELFGVTPDLACFGKAMANGYPLSAVVGRRELMAVFDEIFFSFTFGGEALSLAAARATITKLRERDVVEHLWKQGRRLQDGYNGLAAETGLASVTQCVGLPPRTVATFAHPRIDPLSMRTLFQQELIKRGVLTAGGFNLCYRHGDEEIERTLAACRDTLGILARAVEDGRIDRWLEGGRVEAVFRRA